MLRTQVKSAVCQMLHRTGLDRRAGSVLHDASLPMVLCYHRVAEDFHSASESSIPSMLISTQMLERHLDELGRSYRFISLGQLAQGLEQRRKFDPPAVAITFDDGYQDVYEHAFPLLKRKGIPAAVFVITDMVGTPEVPLHDTLYLHLRRWFNRGPKSGGRLAPLLARLGGHTAKTLSIAEQVNDAYAAVRMLLTLLPQSDLLQLLENFRAIDQTGEDALASTRLMDWDTLAKMQGSGLITIGSHTSTHPVLTSENHVRVQEQLEQSHRELESRLKPGIFHVAYPDGKFDAHTLRAACVAGYQYGYSTCSHQPRNELAMLAIPRRVLWEKSWMDSSGEFSPAAMGCQLNGLLDCFSRCTQNHGRVRPFSRPGRRVSSVEAIQ